MEIVPSFHQFRGYFSFIFSAHHLDLHHLSAPYPLYSSACLHQMCGGESKGVLADLMLMSLAWLFVELLDYSSGQLSLCQFLILLCLDCLGLTTDMVGSVC